MGFMGKILRYGRDYGAVYTLKKIYYRFQIKYRAGRKCFPLQLKEEERSQKAWKAEPEVCISILVPLYNTKEEFLRQMITSVQQQTYPHWELCLADASDDRCEETAAIVREYSAKDARIHYRRLECNGGISENTNQAIAMASGQYLALLDHDDLLHPAALFYVMQEIQQYGADLIYTDELTFDRKPEHVQSVHFKPDFSWESFRSNNYICHFTVFARKLLEVSGPFRSEFDGSQDYDLFLRLAEQAGCIRHVPKVLYYWRSHAGSVASAVAAKPYTMEAGRRALQEHLKRRKIAGSVRLSEAYGSFYKIEYQIPEGSSIRVLPENRRVQERLQNELEGLPWQIRLEEPPAPGAVCFDSSKVSGTSFTLLVRDGYCPEKPAGEWLSELLSCLTPPENQLVSSVVFDGKGKVAHAGYYYGLQYSGMLQPLYQGVPRKDAAYMNRLAFRQTVTLLSGAVLLCRNAVTEQYDRLAKERDWSWSLFSDMAWFSLCLTAAGQGGENILTPYAAFIRPSRKETVLSEAFLESWKPVLERGDDHSSPGIERYSNFGRYYFLWK